MSFNKPLMTCLGLCAAIWTGATALPACADPGTPWTSAVLPQGTQTHDITDLGVNAIAAAVMNTPSSPPPAALPPPVAADAIAGDAPAVPPSPGRPVTAADAAQDSAATVPVCDGYFAQARALAPLLVPAIKALQAHDSASLISQLPSLEAAFDALPPDEVKPEVCNGNHVNAYTRQQYMELSVLRAHGADTGFPANLPVVKQPELAQPSLAFLVGWTKYEQKDFDGALAAVARGLAMFPSDHNLQHEYMSTLLQLKQGSQVVAFVDSSLTGTYDYDDRERASLYEGRGIGLLMLHAADAADENFSLAQRYYYTDEVKSLQDTLRAARAAAQAPAPVAVPAPAGQAQQSH